MPPIAAGAAGAPWHRDPVVWFGALFALAVTGDALFAGRYLPYIDWSNHVGLIAVLAHGGDTGALEYMTRSLAPTPYLLFYGVSAILGQWVSVDVAAKIILLASAPLHTVGAASLASATGRSPRLGLIAPLGLFGVSMGYGFGSFVVATPFLFFALAAAERLLVAAPAQRRRRAAVLAVWIALAFLGHALIFLALAVLLAARALFLGVRSLRDGWRSALTPLLLLGSAAIPAVVLALPAVIDHLAHPWTETGSAPAPGAAKLMYFVPFSEHVAQIAGHLLERGSPAHWGVMYATLGVLAAAFALSLFRRSPRAPGPEPLPYGLELYAIGLLLLFLAGPISLEWPSSIWLVYPRFGVVAAVTVLLLPRVDLSGRLGRVLVLPLLGLVAWNTALNGDHIRTFSSWAELYDPVRRTIPPRARVLPLTVVPDGSDFIHRHPALGSLYFYHLADGASYVPFLFDAAALPVRQKTDGKPRAPFWRNPDEYNPATHGKDYDYLVLRGAGLVTRTRQAALHEEVAVINGWVVFRTKP